jgi:hypothetical protein
MQLAEDTGTHKYLVNSLNVIIPKQKQIQISSLFNIKYPSIDIIDIKKYYDDKINKIVGNWYIIYNNNGLSYGIKIISAIPITIKYLKMSTLSPTNSQQPAVQVHQQETITPDYKEIAPLTFMFNVRYFKPINIDFTRFTGEGILEYTQNDKKTSFNINSNSKKPLKIKIDNYVPLVEEMIAEKTDFYGYTTTTHTISPALLGGKRSRKRRHAKSRRHRKSRRRYT